MTEPETDHVVIGSSLMARLVAGLLATCHGRRVTLAGESQAGYRLARNLDLSVAAMTRPESWSMLKDGVPETLRLIGRIAGRAAWQHVDPIFFARHAGDVEALYHIRHMANGFGMHAEPASSSALGGGRSGIILRDAVLLQSTNLEPALDRWLTESGVRTVRPSRITVQTDGSALLVADGTETLARHAILADADAIIAYLPLPQWPTLLRRIRASTVLTCPRQALAGKVMMEMDSGALLHQQAEGGALGIGRGDLARFSGQLQSLLDGQGPVEQVGQTSYHRLETQDGAPAVGRVGGVGADVIAAIELYGAFLAPALARWYAGQSSAKESVWFGNRLITRGVDASSVAEYRPADAETAQ